MIKIVVRRGDGLSSGRVWLSSVVRNIQLALEHAGHSMKADGKFGDGTEKIVKQFQNDSGIPPTGIADNSTWRQLDPHLAATVGKHEQAIQELLASFRGDLDWVHAREGHRGRPYWPGGASGVTLDPGVDLGHVPEDRIESLYEGILTRTQLRLLSLVFGIKGEDARTALNSVTGIKEIRINREQAYRLMPHTAKPYWKGITRRMKGLVRKDTPPSVQTALLSLAYNRGVFNRGLEPLERVIRDRAWREVAEIIRRMQQNHKLRGIRIRRRQEAALLSAELDFMGLG